MIVEKPFNKQANKLTNYRPHVHLSAEVNNHLTCLGERYVVSTSGPTSIIGFQCQNYCYKSVAIQIPHNVGLAQIPNNGQKFLPYKGSNWRCIP